MLLTSLAIWSLLEGAIAAIALTSFFFLVLALYGPYIVLSVAVTLLLFIERRLGRLSQGDSAVREYVKAHLFEPDPNDCALDNGEIKPEMAWSHYQAWKDSKERLPRAYVHVIDEQERVVFQYWFFYYFNDAFNYHQADWEFVTVFLKREKGDLVPISCAYSAHQEGSFRFWEKKQPGLPGVDLAEGKPIELLDGENAERTHPIAYVAKGSHAFYFEGKQGGYYTSFPAKIGLPGVASVNAKVSSDPDDPLSRDYVPCVSPNAVRRHQSETTYDLVVFPPPDVVRPENQETWNDWWWLHYRGWWSPYNNLPYLKAPLFAWLEVPIGGLLERPSVHGPPHQGKKWSEPWKWAAETCHVDARIPFYL